MDVPADGVSTSMMHGVHMFSSSTANHVHGVLQVCLPVSEECRGSSSPTRSRSHWPCSDDLRPTTSEDSNLFLKGGAHFFKDPLCTFCVSQFLDKDGVDRGAIPECGAWPELEAVIEGSIGLD
ncbi:hypothetical protein Fmac_000774 [Flemingia macrophylla]|uniref:Uncharacterized protein n=1 Tax=Flemingia macrophylla TaxID=520843 RepID=A0ABD1NF71_9FABA